MRISDWSSDVCSSDLVPIAISALSGATLRDTGALGMQAVAQLVPSLAVVQSDGALAQSYRVRGIGSDANIPTFEPDVGLFIDGVYMPRSGLGIDRKSTRLNSSH